MQATRATSGAFRRRAAGVETPNHRIALGGHQGGHIQGCSDRSPATPDLPLPPQRTAVTVERGYTDQRGNLLAVQRNVYYFTPKIRVPLRAAQAEAKRANAKK